VLSEPRERLAGVLRFQADACASLGSPLYAELLGRAEEEVREGDVVLTVLRDHADEPGRFLLANRLMAAVHRLVLIGEAPELAAHYPSAGGRAGDPWPAFLATLREHADQLREWLDDPIQTNEIARCAPLLGGFLEVARRTGLPLRLLEIGASAGLNLRFDHYRYDFGAAAWGPPASPVTIRARLEGDPPLSTPLEVGARAGCDARPVDPTSEDGRLTLESFVWADQLERFARLRAACALAAEVEAHVAQAQAADWIERQLADPVPGLATVVFHSIVIQYLSDDERGRFDAALHDAGQRATAEAPLAWLRMEPAGDAPDLRLTLWPGGEELLLAETGYHGDRVHWLA
jgi:hypothetical protein